MLQLNKLNLIHTKDLSQLLKELTLTINNGEKVAIIGEEGTGKSTLLKAIFHPEKLPDYINMSGLIKYDFTKVIHLPQELDQLTLAKTLDAFLYDENDIPFLDFNLFFQLAQSCRFNLDLLDRKDIRLKDLSGGERLKLQVSKALALNPDLLLLDEPSSDLDLESIIWLEKIIQDNQQTILFISHDEGFLTTCATAILHLELTQKRRKSKWTFFKGSYPEYKSYRQNQYQKQLQIASKERTDFQKKKAKQEKLQASLHHQLNHTKDSTAGRLLAKKMKVIKSQERKLDITQNQLKELPDELESIAIFFSDSIPLPKKKIIFHWQDYILETGQKVNLLIRGQDKLVITGQNGVGKSRLLKTIVTELEENSSFRVGYMPQHYDDLLIENEKVLDFLAPENPEQARNLLASLQLTRQEIEHDICHLSGGQKAKLFLAKMVLDKCNILVLDEPTRHFSPTSQPLVREFLAGFKGAIISVSHDRHLIAEPYLKQYQLDQKTLL
ncbi:ATP-binding cassette domain-containing protein [Streptococcus porcinus]